MTNPARQSGTPAGSPRRARPNAPRRGHRLLRCAAWFGVGVLVLILVIVVTLAIAHEPLPEGRPGPEADALATRIEEAVDIEAWERTGAVRWDFAGRYQHLWDRQRRLARVSTGDVEVLLRLDSRQGRATRDGQEIRGAAASELVESAYAAWVNDSFWLNPLSMLRGDEVSRTLVVLEGGEEALLITFASGGLTPGDSYLWRVGAGGRPSAWRMWVSIIPVGGLEVSWTDWQRLATGALVSTRHEGPLGVVVELSDVVGAETLAELVDGPDPFAPLL